jgi:hypothetical protein
MVAASSRSCSGSVDVSARRVLAALAVSTLAWTAAAADVLLMRNGDRVSGHIVGETSRSIRIETPYGRLVVPRGAIERIQRQGKAEEVVSPPAPDAPPAARATRGVRLVLVVLGKTFWQAWDPKEPPADPTLRFEVRVDEDPVVFYLDATTDPDEIPKALVNAFSFAPGQVLLKGAPGVDVAPPEVRAGRIVLKLDLPPARAGQRKVRLAYQANTGTVAAPVWRDLTEGSLTLALSAAVPRFVQVKQDPGRMEFSGFPRKRMKRVETFRLDPIVE